MTRSVVGWKVYYTGRREFSSADADWEDLPDDGMLEMVVFYDDGRRTRLGGHDWYFHRPGSDLYGANSHGIEENRERYPGSVFKRGKWAEPAEVDWANEQAQNADPP